MAPRRQGSAHPHPQSASLNCRFGSPVRGAFSRLSPPPNASAPGGTDKAQAQGQALVFSDSVSMSGIVAGPLTGIESKRGP